MGIELFMGENLIRHIIRMLTRSKTRLPYQKKKKKNALCHLYTWWVAHDLLASRVVYNKMTTTDRT